MYHAQQSLQKARDRGQSRRKTSMTDRLDKKRKLANKFVPCVFVYYYFLLLYFSSEEEKMPMVIIVGIALGSLLLVCIIVAIVTAVACSFSKRSRRVGTISRRGNGKKHPFVKFQKTINPCANVTSGLTESRQTH